MTTKTDRPKPEVVTSENLAEYQARKLDIQEAPKIDDKQKESVPLAEVKVEPKVEPKVEDKEAKKEDEEQEKKKTKMSERMHELVERQRKAEERAEAAEKKARELEEKYAKPKVEEKKEQDVKPKREDFSDAFEYAEKLADWTVNKRLKEADAAAAEKAKKEAEDKRISTWNEKLAQARKDIPDYDETLDSSKVLVSEEVKEAILESDVGPKILLHLAKNPDEAEKIAKMTVGNAYKAIGRIEAKILDVPPPKEEEKVKVEPKAEVSKAPPPISPLKGASAPVDTASKFTENKSTIVSSTNNLAEYKEARRSGKIK